MSASGATTNYNLSQFISTDIPSWLGDYNGDMLKIDTGINGAKLAADSAALAASAAQNDASTALSNVGTLSTTVGTLSNTVGTAVGNINTINSLIGNGTPTTTDQTIIGAINELHSDQGDLTDLTTTDKTSLVAAINEVAGGGGGGGATVIASVTGDGVTTYTNGFNSMFADLNALSDDELLNTFVINEHGAGVQIYNYNGKTSSGMRYTSASVDISNGSAFETILIDVSASNYITQTINAGGTASATASYGSGAMANGAVWKIVKA